MNIFDRLDGMLIRQEEILRMLGEPEVIADTARFQKLMKEHHLVLFHFYKQPH